MKIRLLLAVLAATLASTAGADAASINFNPGGEILAYSDGSLTFSGGGFSVACSVAFSGTLSDAPVEKVAGERLGSITGADHTCRGGNELFFLWGDFPLEFTSIRGSLPNAVTGLLVTMERVAALITWPGWIVTTQCLYTGSIGLLMRLAGNGPYTTQTMTVLANTLTLHSTLSGGSYCPATGSVQGSFTLAWQQGVVRT